MIRWKAERTSASYMACAVDNEGRKLYAVFGGRHGDYVLFDCEDERILTRGPCPLTLIGVVTEMHEAMQ